MKKYKHKITGNIAIETHSEQNYRVEVPQNFTIPKWIVENSTDWEEIIELCVPIGTKFKHKDPRNIIYKIESIEAAVYITWNTSSYGSYYSLRQVNQFFKEGTWKIYEEKIPIFITEDGVNIYEGDRYYFTDKEQNQFSSLFNRVADTNSLNNNFIRFSTKEKCQEYIDNNKIVLVTKDGINKKRNDFVWSINRTSGIIMNITCSPCIIDKNGIYFHSSKLAVETAALIIEKNIMLKRHTSELIEISNQINNLLNGRK